MKNPLYYLTRELDNKGTSVFIILFFINPHIRIYHTIQTAAGTA